MDTMVGIPEDFPIVHDSHEIFEMSRREHKVHGKGNVTLLGTDRLGYLKRYVDEKADKGWALIAVYIRNDETADSAAMQSPRYRVLMVNRADVVPAEFTV